MNNNDKSLTRKIYEELVDGLRTGLDWTAFIAKHSGSKGPLYNAIGRFFNDMETKVVAANEKLSPVQRELDEAGLKLDQAGLKLNQLDQEIKEAESRLAPLEERRNVLDKQVETLETKLAEKSELIKQVADLEKDGFDTERLRQLQETLSQIGAKHGLKGKETVTKFFDELKDYDAKAGYEQELQRLETITETKKLEAEKQQAETDSLSRRHKDLSEAITVVQNLLKQGIQAEQIIRWDEIVSKVGGPEELQSRLGQYRSLYELLNAMKTQVEDCDKKALEVGAQIKALNEQKIEIEGAIKSLSTSGVKKITEVSDKTMAVLKSLSNSGGKEITKVSDKTMAVLKSLSNTGGKEVTKVSDKAIAEIKSLLAELKVETKRLTALKAEAGKLEKELRYARFFTTGDQTVLQKLPKELALVFLERTAIYCKLNELNPVVKMPNGISRKFPLHYGASDVTLLEIIAWAEAGLAGVSQ